MQWPRTILLEGIQGCGKGTQGKMLAEALGHKLIGSGDLCRHACDTNPDFNREHGGTIRGGKPLPDRVIEPLLLDTVRELEHGQPRILEGFPRNHAQFLKLNELLGDRGEGDDVVVVHMTLPDHKAMKRVMDRGREDDTPDAIRQRFKFYHRESPSVLDAFRSVGWTVYDVSAEPEPNEVTRLILRKLGNHDLLRRLSVPVFAPDPDQVPLGNAGC